jgi:type II secretory pathway pseudopilin PulG
MRVCPYCQAQNVDGAAFCTRCGQALGGGGTVPGAPMAEGEQKGLAITALVAGILSLLGCVGVGSLVAIICGAMAVSRANKEPAVYGGKGMAIAGIVTGSLSFAAVFFIGIIAAIAIPSLLRARVSANESMAIGDTRTVISAQMAYASSNNGSYDNLSCLEQPSSCIPGYDGPTFLDSELASARPKGGYSRALHPGPQAVEITEAMSPTSVTAFAYVAVPVKQGQTGVRGFCGDSNGLICFTPDGSEPEVVDGLCQAGARCTALR